MSYIIYHKESTLRLDRLSTSCKHENFPTLASARGALTRACNKDVTLIKESFDIQESYAFYHCIEKKKTVKNLMTGEDVEQAVNTPRALDVSSNLYWSM